MIMRVRHSRRPFAGRLVAASIAVLSVVLGLASPGAARPDPGRDEPAAGGGPRTAGVTDLATADADRWIVQLDEPSVANRASLAAQAAGGELTSLDLTTAANAGYRAHLEAGQDTFGQELEQVAPGAAVERAYQAVVNGLAVSMSSEEAAAVRELPGVRAVTPDMPFQLDMYATPAQIGAPALWAELGGQEHAGEGVKVAVIDSGIFVRHDANGTYTGNPCFDDIGYTAPRGYPVGDTRFTNDKVIAARAYFRPDDPPAPGEGTPIQGTSAASPHGTHVAGTVACNAGTHADIQGVDVTLSGVAPRAFLMNYRVFYPSTVDDDFQNGNAYTVELVQAIEDAVADGADVINGSWGSSYQNTLAWPDPMVQASEAAVDAGVVMVLAQGNSGPDHATGNSPANSPDVIAVGAVTKNSTIVPGVIDVTNPPDPALANMPVGPAQFGPQVTTTVGPAPFIPAQVASGGSSLGCAPFPAGSLAGAIAVIERGVCEFSTKVFNAQQAGAIAAIVYNSAANGDNIQAMGPGVQAPLVTIPSWFMRRSQGLAMVAAYATVPPGTAQARFTYAPQTAANIGDVMAAFSSRGPTQDKTLKPDVVAPGVDVISSGYAVGDYPTPFTGFGSSSGTSMATPHVAGAAALLLDANPRWGPTQVKSALMTTATEDVFIDTARSVPAGVLDRGAGRIDLAAAAHPGLVFNLASLSGGETSAGEAVSFTVRGRNVSGAAATWTVTAEADDGLIISPSVSSATVAASGGITLDVSVSSAPTAAPGEYEGALILTNAATGQRLHLPVWLGVRPAPTTDVLLVDDDGSSVEGGGFADYSSVYAAALDAAGVTYDYLDVWNEGFPAAIDLYAYRAVVMFTGDNDSFDTSGLTLANQDALAEWLDSGGRLWLSGQNQAETTDSNTTESPNQGRSRIYHGYAGLRYEDGDVYGDAAAPTPTATGEGFLAGTELDLGPNGDGIDNQDSVEAASAFGDNDTFQAPETMTPLFVPIGGDAPDGSAIAFARGSEPSLEEERVIFRYRTISMGFGLEGVNGADAQAALAASSLDWLLSELAVDVHATTGGAGRLTATFTATPTSGADVTQYRWDFGDGSPAVTTTEPTVTHTYAARRNYNVRVEATDVFGHRSISHLRVRVGG
jgi:subtilisin family serine protease